MADLSRVQQVSQAPTRPTQAAAPQPFDVAELYRGPLAERAPAEATGLPLDEKLRQAYFWITNHGKRRSFYCD